MEAYSLDYAVSCKSSLLLESASFPKGGPDVLQIKDNV
jgi:hypothetical protein